MRGVFWGVLLVAFGTSTCNVACAVFPRRGKGKRERGKEMPDGKGNEGKGKGKRQF
jgi:hypothetical protein